MKRFKVTRNCCPGICHCVRCSGLPHRVRVIELITKSRETAERCLESWERWDCRYETRIETENVEE